MGAMAYPLLFCLLLAHLGLGAVGSSRDPPGRPDFPRERTLRAKQHAQQPARASASDPSAPWSRSTDGTILAQKLAEEVPMDVASYLYTGDSHQLKRANCSGRYELAGLPGKSPALASSHPSLHGALDTLTHATNFLNMMLQSNKSREQNLQDDLEWYQALVRSLLEGEPSISRAAITFSTESLSAPAPQVFLQATREESRILLQDLSSSAHHLANATLETEWFHGLRRKWRTHLHRRGSNQGPRGLGHSWRRRDGLGGDKSHVKWSPPYLECENGSYKPGWLVTLSAAFYGLQPNLVPEFRGVMKVDINLQKVDIDQCSNDGWFSGTHKCHLNNSESIRASGLILLETILFGSLLLYFPVVILYFEPSTFRCILLRWVRLLGFATVYGTVTLKLHRVLKVFLSRTAQRIPYMTGGRVMRMLAVILLVVFWFLIGWTSSVCQNLERQISLIGQGQTSDHLIFNMCLIERWDYMTAVAEFAFLLWGVYLCYAVRTVPSAFHEPRYMAVAVHNELIISAIFHTIRFVLASRLQSDWMLMLYFAHTHLTVTVTIGLLLIPKFSHSSNNPRDDIATEAYEDELDMGRSGSYLNSSINSAWSEHSLDPEDIRDELKKLYAQLEIYKRKKMITNNPHLQKKRCSKKGLGRSIMRRITEIPETVSRQCSKEDKDVTDHSTAKSTALIRKNPQESSGNTGKPKEESLKNRVFSLKKSHSTYDHVREQTEESNSLPTGSQEDEATENSTLESLSGKKLTQKLKENSEAESMESVPLVCKSASAHNLSSEKKPGHPRTSMLQKSLSVIASAKEKTLGLTGKTQTSGVEERAKSQKPLPKEKETNRKYSNPDNTETKDSAPQNSNHLDEPRKPQKSGIMKQQRVNPPTANSDMSPGTTQMKDNFDIGEVCPWEIYDLTPGPVPSESKIQKHVSIAASEMEKNPIFSLKEKSHHKPKAAELCQQSNQKSTDKAEVCPWESQGQSLFEDEKHLISKTQVPTGRAKDENGSQHYAANVCAGQYEELPPKVVASKVENENLNQIGDQEKKTSSSEENVPGSYNSSNNFQQPLISRAEVCPWEFETPDQPNAERGVALPAFSALSANKIVGPRK
uniref:G protein-coupled receptor 158 n=1 Tax=Equus asinus TaxID=9793 RepID=A0A9L0JFZ0_EQUAS|nr:probable G-protein coupled receptor 158 [Equus asinus]